MVFELLVCSIVVAMYSCILQGADHALRLAVGPGMLRFREAMLNPVRGTNAVKEQGKGIFVPRLIGKLDAIIGQDGVDAIGHSRNEVTQELNRQWSGSLVEHLNVGELRGAVNSHKQIQLAFFRLNLGNIEVEIPNRIAFETLLSGRSRVSGKRLIP